MKKKILGYIMVTASLAIPATGIGIVGGHDALIALLVSILGVAVLFALLAMLFYGMCMISED